MHLGREEGKPVGSLLPDGHEARKSATAVSSLALVEDGDEEEEEKEEEGDGSDGAGVAVGFAGPAGI